eukprot:365123-Chlamydomonas_euryale.AAC.41
MAWRMVGPWSLTSSRAAICAQPRSTTRAEPLSLDLSLASRVRRLRRGRPRAVARVRQCGPAAGAQRAARGRVARGCARGGGSPRCVVVLAGAPRVAWTAAAGAAAAAG